MTPGAPKWPGAKPGQTGSRGQVPRKASKTKSFCNPSVPGMLTFFFAARGERGGACKPWPGSEYREVEEDTSQGSF